MAAARTRASLVRTLVSAFRVATRPGSATMATRLAAVPRLVRATLDGSYRGTTRWRLAGIAAAVAYVLSPVDLLPESVLFLLGLTDDAMAVTWVAASLVHETESFLAWEREGGRAGAPATVRSEVVPPR